MNKKYLIPLAGLALLVSIVLSGVLLISHPTVWEPMHRYTMEETFQTKLKNNKHVELVFKDANAISGGLWNENPYQKISDSLKNRKLNKAEVAHYEDVRNLLYVAKWVLMISMFTVLMGLFNVGWGKVWNASLGFLILFGVIAGIWMAIHWHSLFRTLHWIIFQDASWILPDNSYSLGLFPHKVWKVAGGVIAAYTVLLHVIGLMLAKKSRANDLAS